MNAVAAYERGLASRWADGTYLGGAIAPGISISTDALHHPGGQAAPGGSRAPARAIGKNTVASMQAGILIGFAGQVNELVRHVAGELGDKPAVVATGGLAPLIAGETTTIQHVDPLLTLEGLRFIHERNRQAGGGLLEETA